MFSIRPRQRSTKAGVRTRMKPARQMISAPASLSTPSSACSKLARSGKAL